ncbi:PPOX class F420-dependent oxidoreductase [Pseudofrankia sp. BMG5.37]|nr:MULTISPECIES: PPOX class F420-dependent oxidoreductase [unclassified Pseudofrankia]MDT3438091.1 PPOX class F420-dependent oxidoreductase [Pseudofrankia sp. BMG5.37]
MTRREDLAVAKPPLPEKVSELLVKPNPSVMTTMRPDGQPVSVATWYLWEDGRVLVNLDEGRKRLEYLRSDPRVSLTVLKADDWYTHVSLQGQVVELKDDPDLVDIDRIATHYTGQPYPDRVRGRVSAWIEVVTWHGWVSGRKMAT